MHRNATTTYCPPNTRRAGVAGRCTYHTVIHSAAISELFTLKIFLAHDATA